MATYLPTWRWERPRGGPCLWVRLPDGGARSFALVAERHGVAVSSGAEMSPRGAFDDHLRLPFAGHETGELVEAVRRLAAAWAEYVPTPMHRAVGDTLLV